MSDKDQTPPSDPKFDPSSIQSDSLVHERRWRQRRGPAPQDGQGAATVQPAGERRVKKERRRRIDPTTFEKQYTDDELEFMNAMQRYKVQTGKSFPTHGEVLMIARQLGYRKDQAGQPAGDLPAEDRPSK